MAKKKNTTTKPKPSNTSADKTTAIEDAEIVNESVQSESPAQEARPEDLSPEDEKPVADHPQVDEPDATVMDPEAASANTDDPKSAEPLEAEAHGQSPIPAGAEAVGPNNGRWGTVAISAVIAAVLAYAVPTFLFDPQKALAPVEGRLDGLVGELREVRSDVEQIEVPDMSPLEQAVAAHSSGIKSLGERLVALEDAQGNLVTRVNALEARPIGTEGGLTEGDLADLRAALDAQMAEADALRDELATLAATQEAGIANAETEALNAARAAKQAAARQALLAALDSGAPYDELLEQFDPPLPDAVQRAASGGIPTVESLNDPFDTLARDALDVARTQAVQEGDAATRIATFLRAQVGARSVEPREGSDPDAVLSRAQAAVRAGEFAAALAELDALPEGASVVFDTWRESAQVRINAVSAVTDYLSAN